MEALSIPIRYVPPFTSSRCFTILLGPYWKRRRHEPLVKEGSLPCNVPKWGLYNEWVDSSTSKNRLLDQKGYQWRELTSWITRQTLNSRVFRSNSPFTHPARTSRLASDVWVISRYSYGVYSDIPDAICNNSMRIVFHLWSYYIKVLLISTLWRKGSIDGLDVWLAMLYYTRSGCLGKFRYDCSNNPTVQSSQDYDDLNNSPYLHKTGNGRSLRQIAPLPVVPRIDRWPAFEKPSGL